jgi:hypothetical protein
MPRPVQAWFRSAQRPPPSVVFCWSGVHEKVAPLVLLDEVVVVEDDDEDDVVLVLLDVLCDAPPAPPVLVLAPPWPPVPDVVDPEYVCCCPAEPQPARTTSAIARRRIDTETRYHAGARLLITSKA